MMHFKRKIYGHDGHLGRVTQVPQTNFHSSDPWRPNVQFGFNLLSGLMFETFDRRTTDPWPYDKLT